MTGIVYQVTNLTSECRLVTVTRQGNSAEDCVAVAEGFLIKGDDRVNHGLKIDGMVAVLTVKIVDDSATVLSVMS